MTLIKIVSTTTLTLESKSTYVKESTAQKTKVYDMYASFYRWSMDRIDKNGVIAFVTNRSFIDSRTFDGFRKVVEDEFDYIYIVDTRSDVRANPKIAGTTHNVFGIQTGVAIMFLVKEESKHKTENRKCRIEYIELDDFMRKEDKLAWLRDNRFANISFEKIEPDDKHNWINLADNDFDTLLPLIDKDVKLGKKDEAIFELYTLGVATNRDDWVYSVSKDELSKRMFYFSESYNNLLKDNNLNYPPIIKWSRDLKNKFEQKRRIDFDKTTLVKSLYRPFVSKYFFSNKITSDVFTQNHLTMFGDNLDKQNMCLGFIGKDTIIPFSVLAFDKINDLNGLSNAAGGTKTLPLYRYDSEGQQLENITDWALEQFRNHYKETPTSQITKQDIFHYVYAVLHNPQYRQKYELNLKREFPRIPFYDDFWQWSMWGAELMDLHINYETQTPFNLKEINHRGTETQRKTKDIQDDLFDESNSASQRLCGEDFVATPKTKLKADKINGIIEIDSVTQLTGIPPIAWEYKLGNRSALEWILDQYKERKPQDATIAEKFNNYKFEDYKENVIELLKKVCTVSVETMEIIAKMPK